MTWNYRIVKISDEEYALKEVYYTGKGVAVSYGDPALYTEEVGNIANLGRMIAAAFQKPVIDAKDFYEADHEDEGL